MNHPTDMLRQPGIAHLSNNMLGSPHFLQQGQQQQPSSSQSHPMGVLQNGPNSNPAMGMGNTQSQSMGHNPTPAQMYQSHHLNQQRRAQALITAQTTQGMNANPGGPPHMNGIGHNPAMNYPNSMMQPTRRVPSQPGLNQPVMSGMHSGQQNMPNMGALGMNQAMTHQIRMPSQQMNSRMPQQPLQPSQMPGPMSSEISMSLNRQSHMQGNPGLPPTVPRVPPAQPPLMGNIPTAPTLPQTHPGMQNPMHQINYQNPIPMPHQQTQSLMGQSAHSGPHAQAQTAVTIPMQQPMTDVPNRRITPDNSLFNMPFQNQQFNQSMTHNNRMNSNNQFGFPSTSTPPDQDMGTGMSNASGAPSRTGFHLTPAQQFQRSSSEFANASTHFHMTPHQSHAPSRPPSHNPPPSQQSPDHLNSNGSMSNLQRPPSQPQIQPGPGPTRPPSQAGPSRTPHMTHPPLPSMQQSRMQLPMGNSGTGNGPPGAGLGSQPGPPQPPQIPVQQTPSGQQGHPFPTGVQRQQSQSLSVSAPGSAGPPCVIVDGNSSQPPNPSQHKVIIPPIGMGQGVLRLLQFSAILAGDTKSKTQLPYWESIIKDYFTPKAVMKYTLWKDEPRNEAKIFEIGVPILPRFFLVTSQSGVKSMNVSLDGARERIISPGRAVVECVSAVWTYKYTNGYTIHLRGPLTAHIWVVQQQQPQPTSANAGPLLALKFEHLQFEANFHDKCISVDAIIGPRLGKSPSIQNVQTSGAMNGGGTQQQQLHQQPQQSQPDGKDERIHYERSSIPIEPVNAFGVPQATMRCLELAESVAQMTDLIQFSLENQLGPLQSLKQFAKKIRESQGHNAAMRIMPSNNNPMVVSAGFQKDPAYATKTGTAVSLYPGPPASSMQMPTHHTMAPNTPQNPPSSGETSSPSKQNKATPSTQPPPVASTASSSTPTSTPASTATNTTPSLAAATLKRKANNDTASPTIEHAPPSKRATRKRRATGGGG